MRKEIELQGRVYVYQPTHPRARMKGYILRSWAVMEQHIHRHLTSIEVVHHINGDMLDDRIENLMLFPNGSEHTRYHHRLNDTTSYGYSIERERECLMCGKKFKTKVHNTKFCSEECVRLRYSERKKKIYRDRRDSYGKIMFNKGYAEGEARSKADYEALASRAEQAILRAGLVTQRRIESIEAENKKLKEKLNKADDEYLEMAAALGVVEISLMGKKINELKAENAKLRKSRDKLADKISKSPHFNIHNRFKSNCSVAVDREEAIASWIKWSEETK